jgi:dTDP-4-amino-4,6-dideoxygalactose transaminase
MVDKYRWMDIGSSYLPSDLLAAFLTAQLEHFTEIQRRRMHIWNSYHSRLAGWAAQHQIGRPTVPADRAHPAHLYYLMLPDLESRQGMLKDLNTRGVQGTFHYQPLHNAPAGVKFGRTGPDGCPVTEDVADRLIRLPLYADMTDNEIDAVVEAVESYPPRW